MRRVHCFRSPMCMWCSVFPCLSVYPYDLQVCELSDRVVGQIDSSSYPHRAQVTHAAGTQHHAAGTQHHAAGTQHGVRLVQDTAAGAAPVDWRGDGSGIVGRGQTRSDEVRRGQTRSDEVRRGQTRSDEVRRGQTRSDEVVGGWDCLSECCDLIRVPAHSH